MSETDERLARAEQRRKEHNAEVRERTECIHCGDTVPDEDYSAKYMQAGGALAGPYCDMSCQFGALMD